MKDIFYGSVYINYENDPAMNGEIQTMLTRFPGKSIDYATFSFKKAHFISINIQKIE
jgi:hypothetical protein